MTAPLHPFRWILVITLAGLFGAFAVQNAAAFNLQVFAWTITTRPAVLALAAMLLGFCLGWVFGRSASRP